MLKIKNKIKKKLLKLKLRKHELMGKKSHQ